MNSYLSCGRQSVDLHFAKGYLTGGSENGTGMDHVRLLSTQAGEHTAYTTRLSVANTSRSTMDQRRDKPKRESGNREEPKKGRSSKGGKRKEGEKVGKNM